MPYGSGGFRPRSGGFQRSFGGPREMHKIKCSECGKEAEVPFKPIEGKPVYCRDCFFKKKGITPREAPKKEEKSEVSETAESAEVAEEVEEESEE